MLLAHFGEPGSYSKVGYQCAGCQIICEGFDQYRSHFDSAHKNIKNVCKTCYVVFTNEKTLKQHVPELEMFVKVQLAREKSAKNDDSTNTVVSDSDLIVANEEVVETEVVQKPEFNLNEFIKINKTQKSPQKTTNTDKSSTSKKPETFQLLSALLEKNRESKNVSPSKTLMLTNSQQNSENSSLEPGEIDRKSIMLKQISDIVMPNEENKNKIRVKNASTVDLNYIAGQLSKKLDTPRREKPRDPNIARFECNYCPKRFTSRAGFNGHIKLHTGECVTCDICFKKFSNRGHLKSHLVSHTKIKAFKCDVCDMMCTTKQGLKLHQIRHQPHHIKCSKCGKPFLTQESFDKHAETHLNDLPRESMPKNYKCTICDHLFVKLEGVKNHIKRIHFDERPHPCTVCNKFFKTRSEVTAHLKIHDKNRPYVISCELCGQGFYKKQGLATHNLRKHTLNTSSCHLCSRIFETTEARDAHVANHPLYTTKSKKFACSGCELKFQSKLKLLRHISKTHDINNLTCTICDKIFKTKRDLKFHQTSSHSEFHLKCAMCDMEFRNLRYLQIHEETHLEEASVIFKCGDCGDTFSSLKQFHIHRETHKINPKAFCIYCNKNCKTKSNLECHLKVHKAGKRLCCTFCYSWYETKKTLEQHMILKHIHTEDEVVLKKRAKIDDSYYIKCPRCFKKFQNEEFLQKHLDNHPYILELDSLNNRVTCNICEATFKTPAILKIHEDTHYVKDDKDTYMFDEAQDVFVCYVCDQTFESNELLKQHNDNNHDVP